MRTGEPTVDALLRRLVGGQLGALGTDPIGIYLFGSAVTGDFEPGVSDVDVAVVAASDITTSQLRALDQMHAQIVRETPEWDDRIDTVYVSADGLRNFREVKTPGARISPGEPFHAIVLDDRWLIDWYQVRKIGVTLFGRPAASVIPRVSLDEYVADVRRYIRSMSR